MKRIPLVLFVLLGVQLSAEPNLLDQGRDAQAAENYQKALELYQKARDAAPTTSGPHRALAQLFTGQGLHELALPEWQAVVRLSPDEADGYQSLAQTLSYLNRNSEGIQVLDQALARFRGNADVAQALAWLLFKTEDYRRGVQLLESFIAQFGASRSLEMTLGTLYSSLLEYDLSRAHYLKSLALAPGKDLDSRLFRSVAWYNLSLLEKDFYQFDLADQAIQKSLGEQERPAGALARGELFQGRRDYSAARKLFDQAAQNDDTPLSLLDQALLEIEFGHLDSGERALNGVEQHRDVTWIYNYGVTKEKMDREVQSARALLHESRFHALDFEPRKDWWDWLPWTWKKIKEAALWWYHDQRWKSLVAQIAESSLAVKNSPEAWSGLAQANKDHPTLALTYFHSLRDHELPRNPRFIGSYLVQEGIATKDPGTIRRGLARVQIPWENEDRERGLAILVDQSTKTRAERRDLLNQMFAINPGSLLCHGWGLPLRFSIVAPPTIRTHASQVWTSYANQTGWDLETKDRPGVAWDLDLSIEDLQIRWSLRDAEGSVRKSGLAPWVPGSEIQSAAAIYQRIHSPL